MSGGVAGNVADERKLLNLVFRKMEEAFADGERPVIVGHNIIGFDLLFLAQRAVVLGVRLPAWWPRNPRPGDSDVFDTMIQWAPARDSWLRLDILCRALGIDGKGDMDGSKIYAAWQAGELDKIWSYNADDVGKVSQIHRKIGLAWRDMTAEERNWHTSGIRIAAEISRLLRPADTDQTSEAA